jgi:probable blue pigment (indigoidine) exporter
MFKNILPGLLFAVLWASGSVVVKFGILSADALLLASIRFICTGLIFAPLLLLQGKHRVWPKGAEWKHILIYGLLNTTLTLGSFFAAQKFVSAGISMLFIAVAPLLIALFSALFLSRKLTTFEVIGMLTAFTGLVIASSAGLSGAHISVGGIMLLLVYITAYAVSSIYFSGLKLKMSNVVFNVWQVFFGGIILLPFCLLSGQSHIKHIDANLILSLMWMIVVLSFIANQLWLYLIKSDTVKAAGWLYLTPVFGYLYGYLLLGEKVTIYAFAGTALVITGLILSKKGKRKTASAT